MKVAAAIVAVSLALAGCGGGGPERGQGGAADNDLVITLAEQNDSGQSGTATLEAAGDRTSITIELVDATGGVADSLPTHVHKGTCADPDEEVAFMLPDTFDGISGDTVDISVAELQADGYAIDVHAVGGGKVLSCGEITSP